MEYLYAAVPKAVDNIKTEVVNPILKVLIALSVLYFLWGVVKYFVGAREKSDSSEALEGRNHLLWGLVGVAITISAFGIVNVIIDFVKTVGS